MIKHHYQQLIDLFGQTFAQQYRTQLVAGNDEPLYLPADTSSSWHRIIFAHGFYASALHEISHWCLAGKARRQQIDYGYWYLPDGRDYQAQVEFEAVELKPQSLDWLFCQAAGYPFYVSSDNLGGHFEPDRLTFQRNVWEQVIAYLKYGIPQRPQCFIQALQAFYATPPLTVDQFPFPPDIPSS